MGYDRKGLHLTCCQWDHADEECSFTLGAETEWTGRHTSIFFAPGAKLIEEEGIEYDEDKIAVPEPEPEADDEEEEEPEDQPEDDDGQENDDDQENNDENNGE